MSDAALGQYPDPALAARRLGAFQAAARFCVRSLTLLGIALFFLVSPMLLFNWGFSYEDVGGSVIEKVHPGTWLVLLALVLVAFGRGNPLTILDDFSRPPALAMYLFAWALLMFFTIVIKKGPFTPLIDTFALPAMLFALAGTMAASEKRRAALIIHLLLNANALLGLYEYLSGYRLTPYVAGTLLIEVDWRSTALLGHPLANASITGSYALLLGLGGGQDLPKLMRPAVMSLQLIAMIAFGGRSALVLTILLLACVGFWDMSRFLRGGRVDMLQTGLMLMAAPVVIAAFIYAIDAGFFDQMLQRFVDDQGSAKARVIMLKLFNYITWEDLVFGPDSALISSLQRTEGIEYGIESFWVAFILTNGVAMSMIFFLALFAFSWQLVTATRINTVILLIYFYLLASTSVSLSAKTCSFGMFVIMILTMMRVDAPSALRAIRVRR